MKSIAVTSKSFSKNEYLINELKSKFPTAEIKLQTAPVGLTQEELIKFFQGVEGAIVGLEKINDEVLSQCPDLKIVSKFGVGLDNIDKEACEKHNVKIGWTGGVNKRSVAEMTLGFMLGLCRNLFISSTHMRAGNWVKNGGIQLTNRTIGIIGVGHIGKDLVGLLKPFGCTILVNDIIEQNSYYEQHGLIPSTKEEIYQKADIITVHTPLTKETKNLFNKETFLLMKEKCPIIINTARGGIVNEDDLIFALENNHISSAALDAYEVEPLNNEKVYSHQSVITTPHIGGNAAEAVRAMGMSAIQNLTTN